MASTTKQQKRALRAKAKAKQQRSARSTHQPEHPGKLAKGIGSIEWFEALFAQWLEAENQSRKALFVALYISIADLIALNHALEQELTKSDDSSEAIATLSRCFLVDYRKWAYGATEIETMEWLTRADVISDFSQARDEVVAKFAADSFEHYDESPSP